MVRHHSAHALMCLHLAVATMGAGQGPDHLGHSNQSVQVLALLPMPASCQSHPGRLQVMAQIMEFLWFKWETQPSPALASMGIRERTSGQKIYLCVSLFFHF